MSTDERTRAEMVDSADSSRRSARRKNPARPRKWTRPPERSRTATENPNSPLDESEIEEAISAADIQFRKVQQEIRRRIAERAEAARLAHMAADERREAAVTALQVLAQANDGRQALTRHEDIEEEDDRPESELFVPREPDRENAWPRSRVTAGFLLFTSLCTAASAILVNGLVTGTWPLIESTSDRPAAQVEAVTMVEARPVPSLPAVRVPEAAPQATAAAAVQPPADAVGEAPPAESAETARAIQSWALDLARPASPTVPARAANAATALPAAGGSGASAGATSPRPGPASPDPASQADGQPVEKVTIMPAATVAEQITGPGTGSTAAFDTVEIERGQPQAPAPVPVPAAEQLQAPQVEARLQPAAPAADEAPPGAVSQADQLIESGQTYLSHGDIASARLYFERAAELGDVRALIGLARTYDPVIFEQLGVLGMKPDAEKAMQYYLRARAAGSPDALAGIDALALYFGR